MNKGLIFAIGTILIDAIGVGIVFPIMPDLMADVGAANTADAAIWGGILFASYALMQFLFSPPIGNLSDAFGRRPVLLLALAALTLDYILMAVAPNFWLLLVGRVLAGICGATYVTATAYLADVSPPEKRAANFGLIGAAFGVGFILGPALAGLVAEIDVRAPFYLAAALSFGNFLYGLLILPESLSAEKRRSFSFQDSSPIANIRKAFALPELRLPLMVVLLFDIAAFVYPAVWAYYGREAFDWSTRTIGLSLSAYGIAIVITQGWLIRLAIPRLGEAKAAFLGIIASVLALIGLAFAPSSAFVFAMIPVAALGEFTPAALTGIMSNRVGEDRQGILQGILSSISAVQSIIGPLLMTAVFQLYADEVGLYFPGAPFLLAAIMMVLIVPSARRLVHDVG